MATVLVLFLLLVAFFVKTSYPQLEYYTDGSNKDMMLAVYVEKRKPQS